MHNVKISQYWVGCTGAGCKASSHSKSPAVVPVELTWAKLRKIYMSHMLISPVGPGVAKEIDVRVR